MNRHLILIHGAWQGSWSFAAWRPLLARQGWHTHAVDLPGNGWNDCPPESASLETYVDHVCALIDTLDGPVVVLGHSGGGIVASQVAETRPAQVACLVYLAGMMLPSGLSFAQLVSQCREAHPEADLRGIGAYLEYDDEQRFSSVPPDAARRIFLHDCPDRDADFAVGLFRPQAERGRAMTPSLSPERYGRVPRIYVEALQDRSVAHLCQRRMQALCPGATRITLDCGHVPQLAQPERLTELLCSALEHQLATAPIPRITPNQEACQ